MLAIEPSEGADDPEDAWALFEEVEGVDEEADAADALPPLLFGAKVTDGFVESFALSPVPYVRSEYKVANSNRPKIN